jgi:UDP-2,3-diacylglucosamine pyrophosphatase LpxH
MTTLIVSDIHLGARNNRADLLTDLLTSDFDRLVLNGDTVDSLDLRRFSARDWRVVEHLRAIANERELVLVRGNHDGSAGDEPGFGPLDVLGQLLGVEMVEEYEVPVGPDRYLVLHGHHFDYTMNMTWLGDAADWLYRQTQRSSRRLAHFLKGRVKNWGGVVGCVQRGALRYARARGYAGIVTGHTHFWHDEHLDGVHFLNTGCWVDWPCSYVRIQGGDARVFHWEPSLQEVRTSKSMLLMQAS